ncbi:MAG: hypothetical protein WD850_02775 [Candidatus Spechtbacterales bacterium]
MTYYSAELEENQMVTSLAVFVKNYNKSVPRGFRRATSADLREFQMKYPSLFRRPDEWSIDRHRKRLMDWLASG